MSCKKVWEFDNQEIAKQVRVFRDTDAEDYIVEFYADGIRNADADYFTGDVLDAVNTARLFVGLEPVGRDWSAPDQTGYDRGMCLES